MDKKAILRKIAASLIAVVIGLFVGFIVLLFINPAHAAEGMGIILKNFLYFSDRKVAAEYFGSALMMNVPLCMCALSFIYAKGAGLFNIGVCGQYTVGSGIALYLGIKCGMPWWVCLLAAMLFGGLTGMLVGYIKAYRNVNEVIGGIMINWIALYGVNTLLSGCTDSNKFTLNLFLNAENALLPAISSQNQFVTIAIPLTVICAFLLWFIYKRTRFGFETTMTGLNRNAARLTGVDDRLNITLTMLISGAFAGLGGAMFYLSGISLWPASATAIPAVGFTGIAAAFLGGLSPFGVLFSSYFIEHITMGSGFLNRQYFPSEVSGLISSIIIYVSAFSAMIERFLMERKKEVK